MKKIVIAGLATLVATPLSALAYDQGDMILRVGATTVDAAGDFEPDGVSAKSDTQLGLNFVYMATKNIGIEVLASTPFKHDIEADGVGVVGETKHLPPTVSAQYYFDTNSIVTPYVGAGINYTIFFGEKWANGDEFELKNSVGLALQVGADFAINDHWGVNIDIRKIDIDTEVKGAGIEVAIDPMVYSLTAAYKF